MIIHEFRPNNMYCIDESLNQLIWSVENCLFIILENSSRIYLNSGNFIFKVNASDTMFNICFYGVNTRESAKTRIKVVKLDKKTPSLKELKIAEVDYKKSGSNLNSIVSHSKRKTLERYFPINRKKVGLKNKGLKKTNLPLNQLEKQISEINNLTSINQLTQYKNEKRLL